MIEPKPISRICTFAILVSVTTGCTSTRRYLLDRKKDVADIFTLCGGVGAGGQVRVGRIPIGAVAEADLVGLRYGDLFCRSELPVAAEETNTTLLNIAAACCVVYVCPWACKSLQNEMELTCEDDFPLSNVQVRRGKGLEALWSSEWFTVEVLGGVGPTARVGFNAAELLDFAVGWTTIDILGDDWEGQERRMARLAAEKAARLAAKKTSQGGWRSWCGARPKDVSERALCFVASTAATSAQGCLANVAHSPSTLLGSNQMALP